MIDLKGFSMATLGGLNKDFRLWRIKNYMTPRSEGKEVNPRSQRRNRTLLGLK